MQTNYQVLRLVNGVIIVGDAVFEPSDVTIKLPLEVVSNPIMDKGVCVGERMVLRPFMIMTDEKELVVDKFNVLTSNSLSAKLVKSYQSMVDSVYKTKLEYDGSFMEKEDPLTKMTTDQKEDVNKLLASLINKSIMDDDNNGTIH